MDTKSFTPTTDSLVNTRKKMVAAYADKAIRLGSRFTFSFFTPETNKVLVDSSIEMKTLLKSLGYHIDGSAQYGEFMHRMLTYFGYNAETARIMTNASIRGMTIDQVLPVNFMVYNVLCLTDTITKITTKGKKGKKVTMINLLKARTMVWTWYHQGSTTVTDPKMIGMTIYGFSPSVRDVETLFGKRAIAFKVIIMGTNLVIVDKKVTTVEESVKIDGNVIKPWSKITMYDIDDADHNVPFTRVIIKLIENGYVDLTEAGITDVESFINTTFSLGLDKAYTEWMTALGTINRVNAKIKPNADMITDATKKGYTPEIVKIVSVAGSKVFDDNKTDTTDEILVAIGASVDENWGLGLPTNFDTTD